MYTRKHETKRRLFTLVELLVVIAIITILAGLLLPALQHTMRISRNIRCVNGLKQVGLGIISYCGENEGYYPSRTAPGSPGETGYYEGRRYMQSKHGTVFRNNKSPYNFDLHRSLDTHFGEGTGIRDVFVCPFTLHEMTSRYGSDVRTVGSTALKGFPYKFSATNKKYFAGYYLYFSVYGASTAEAIKKPMNRLGQKWQMGSNGVNGSGNLYSKVIVSDIMFNGNLSSVGNRMNHPPSDEGAEWRTELTGGEEGAWYRNRVDGTITDANYLLDDGSVQSARQVSYLFNDIGGGRKTNSADVPLIPKSLFSSKP